MTDDEILRCIPRGGSRAEAALEALYARYAQEMLKFFVYQGIHGYEAQDVLQETIIKIVRGATSYRGTGLAAVWIWQIARSCMLDTLHRRRHDPDAAANDDKWQMTSAGIAAAGRRSDPKLQDGVVRDLADFAEHAPECALVLTLFIEGLSLEEIGLRIGRSASATNELLLQCRKEIRDVSHCNDLVKA